MNAGLRFDQMWQYVDANQLSPRLSFTYKPFKYTTFHAGYARYFTPPVIGRGGAGQYRAVQWHDRGASLERRNQPGAAGTRAMTPGVNQKIPLEMRFSCKEKDVRRPGSRP